MPIFRDIEFIKTLLKAKKAGDKCVTRNITTADFFADCVKKHGDAECLVFEGASWTFNQVDAESDRMAQWGLSVGLEKANTVALVMENCPTFLFVCLGMAKIGVTVALINYNLVGKPLAFSMEQTGCRLAIFDASTSKTMTDFSAAGSSLPLHFVSSHKDAVPSFATQLDPTAHEAQPVDASVRTGITVTDTLFHIFTSGTTGLPKAARINHLKACLSGFTMFSFQRVRPRTRCSAGDRVYVTLPLYHSSAMLIGVFGCLSFGIPLCLRRKFSASNFFEDCRKVDATVVLYIGELCRYLNATPPTATDRKHRVRLAIGNGMRPDVWAKFQQRFGVRTIGEFYASTEGNANLINNANKMGAIGYVSPLIAKKYPVKIVKFDVESESVVRDESGRCVPVAPGEAGELIGYINNKDVTRRFDGYSDRAATEKKILKDVMMEGDMYFRTGDLVRQDKEGFVYFVDRIGDTFRWKGENVSTAEVSEVVASSPGVTQANVYGVQVGDIEGRAGMASIVAEEGFSLEALYERCAADLPKYAAPLFVRQQAELEMTGTFKNRKVNLVEEGFDPSKVADALFFRDDAKKQFVKLDAALYERIVSGEMKL